MAGALSLRRATPDDAEAFVAMMGDPAVYPGLMQTPFPSPALWRERLAERGGPAQVDLHLVAVRDVIVVGSAGLHSMGPHLRRRHVAGLRMAVAAAAQRQGVGTALMQALCEYADGWAQLLRIELSVFTDNAAAIALYGRFGFEVEGTHRAYALRDGVYADVHTMARLHPNPPILARA